MEDAQSDVVSGDTFPTKLHKLLSHAEKTGLEHIVSWLPGTNKFRVHNKELFAEEIMPNYFSSSAYKTFQRNLNLWGFRTISKGVHKGECSHDQFVRGDIDRCRRMVRVRIKSEGPPDDQDTTEETAAPIDPAVDVGRGIQVQTSVPRDLASSGGFLGVMQQIHHIQQAQQSAGLSSSAFGNGINGGGGSNNRNLGSNSFLSSLAALVKNNSSTAINPMSALHNQAQPPVTAPGHAQQVMLLQKLLQLQQRQTQAPPPQPQPQPGEALNQQLLALLAMQQSHGSSGSGASHRNLMTSNEMNVTPSNLNLESALLALSQVQQRQQQVVVPAPPPRKPSPIVDSGSVPDAHSDAREQEPSRGGDQNKEASNASRSKTLREAAMQRSSQVIACRARGLAMDHNMHTAFFEIPNDAEHGMELVCSFPACRNGGVKFLFCRHCKDAIARRSFRTNHAHEDQKGPSLEVKSRSSSNTQDDHESSTPSKRMKRSTDDDGLGALAAVAVGSANIALIETSTTHPASETPNSGPTPPQSYPRSSRCEALKAQWDQLLEERRKSNSNNAADVTSWLAKVMAVSNEFAAFPCTTEEST